MTIAYACILFMGLFPYVAAGIAKKGFEGYDNSMPRQWLAKQTGFRARANAAQANLFESLPFFFAAVIIAHIANAPQVRIDLLAIGFVVARIAYLVCYVANWPTTRSIVWLAGIACVVAMFFQI
ncbi:MAPEG family protein [Polynucleobacter necessarius]|uniref:MAPEG family protein n=1 Tax=Polynucleobacter necessarius TaxID=576610 RepID=UPI000FE18AB3|nr:MAPEG family protein [Polynucleobacter necessarius]